MRCFKKSEQVNPVIKQKIILHELWPQCNGKYETLKQRDKLIYFFNVMKWLEACWVYVCFLLFFNSYSFFFGICLSLNYYYYYNISYDQLDQFDVFLTVTKGCISPTA